MVAEIHAARGDLVEMRLPEVRALLLDEFDRGPAMLAKLVTEASRQFEATGTATDDDDFVWPTLVTTAALIAASGKFISVHSAHHAPFLHLNQSAIAQQKSTIAAIHRRLLF
jgi:hypothetical protein